MQGRYFFSVFKCPPEEEHPSSLYDHYRADDYVSLSNVQTEDDFTGFKLKVMKQNTYENRFTEPDIPVVSRGSSHYEGLLSQQSLVETHQESKVDMSIIERIKSMRS